MPHEGTQDPSRDAATDLRAGIDLDLTRDALASSTLNHGLMVLSDRWTVAVLLGAFVGVRRFDEWHERLGIPRPTLADRLKKLVELDLLRQRQYQDRPPRHAYHLTSKGLKLYDHVLMIWSWERRFGTRAGSLPTQLRHAMCGHVFTPHLACSACGEDVGINDLHFTLKVNKALLARATAAGRTPRIAAVDGTRSGIGMGLGLRVDRWSLMIITAVLLGCRYFDQLAHVLGIASSVLARRLAGMVETGLLTTAADRHDARRVIYRLTPASRDLFGYIVCFSSWASRFLLHQPSSIAPTHHGCGKPFVGQVVCDQCREPLMPWDVQMEALPQEATDAEPAAA